jgi:hypothetical protein
MENVQRYSCAVVTGASSGLGEEFALQLAPRVGRLVLVARRGEMLEDLAQRIGQKFACEVIVLVADLACGDQRVALIAELNERGLVPDLLVNNAGLGDYGEFHTADWEKLQAMLRVNIEALVHLTHALVPGMIGRERAAVINVSSLASILPIPDFAVYAATKACVTSFSEALRIELKEHGIEVLALCPGPVHTGFGEVARRGENAKGMPSRELFYVAKERVVAEAFEALERRRARVFPGLRTTLAAQVFSLMPLGLMRWCMSRRPRRS